MPEPKHTVPNAEADDDSGALVSRLRVIEDQPLDQRAPAFVQIHERLQAALEGGDQLSRQDYSQHGHSQHGDSQHG